MNCNFSVNIDGEYSGADYLDLDHEDTDLITTDIRDGDRYHKCPRETIGDDDFCLFHQLPHDDPRQPEEVYPWLESTPSRRDSEYTDTVVSRIFRRAVEGTLNPEDPPCDVIDRFSSEQYTHLRRVFIGSQFDYLDLKHRELDTPGRHAIDLRLSHIRICNLNYVHIRTTLQMDGSDIGIFTARNGHIDESLILDGITCGQMDLSGERVRTSPRSSFGESEDTKCSVHGAEIGLIFSMDDARIDSDVAIAYAQTNAQLTIRRTNVDGTLWGDGFRTDSYLSLKGSVIDEDCSLKTLRTGRYLSIQEGRVGGDCDLRRADTGRYVSFNGSEIGGDCNLREISVDTFVKISAAIGGKVTFARASIDDDIRLGDCTIAKACHLTKTIVAQDLSFEGLVGGFVISGAQIGGDVDFKAGSVAPRAAVSRLPDWMERPEPIDSEYEVLVQKTWIDGGFFAATAVVRGSVEIRDSTIAYQFVAGSARITGSLEVVHTTTQAVIADELRAGSVTLDYTTVDLSVRIRHATVFGGISLDHLIVGDDVPAGGLDYGMARTNEQASLGGVNLTGTFVGGLSLKRSQLDGGIEMSYLTNTGDVALVNATLGEALVARYTTTFGEFNAEFATIGDQANLSDSLVCGNIILDYATVENSLVMTNASTLGSALLRGAEIGTSAAQSSAAVQLANSAIGGHLNGRQATFGDDFDLSGATIRGGAYLERTTFKSTLRLLEADHVRQGEVPTTLEDSIRLNDAVVEGNFELAITDQSRTQIRGIVDLDAITVHGETNIELPAARYSPRILSLRGAEIRHGTFSYAEPVDTLPGRYLPATDSDDETDTAAGADTTGTDSTNQGDARNSLPMMPDLSLTRDEYSSVPRMVLNLERATVGDLSLFPDTPQPTDHVHILETTFNGFRFNAVREDFRNSEWSVHEVRDGEEGYRDLAVANALHEIVGDEDDTPIDRDDITDRAIELFSAGLEDPDSIREMVSMPAAAREQNQAEIEVTVESLAALAAEAERPGIASVIETIEDGQFSQSRQPIAACLPFTRLARQVNRLLARQIIESVPDDRPIESPQEVMYGVSSLVQQLLIAIHDTSEARQLIHDGAQNNDPPTVGEVLQRANIDIRQPVEPILQAPVPDLAVALAYALEEQYENLELPKPEMGAVVYIASSAHRPGAPLLLPKQDATEYRNTNLVSGGIGYDAVTIEDTINRARWRVSVLAAIEHADPSVVRPTPDRIEATYLALKNAAADVGDNRAAGEFFTQEKTWARARHRLLSGRRLRARVNKYRQQVAETLPGSGPSEPNDGGEPSAAEPSEAGGEKDDPETVDHDTTGSTDEMVPGDSLDEQIEEETAAAQSATEATTSPADEDDSGDEDPEETNPMDADSGALTSSRKRALATDSEQKALEEPLIPVLYAFVANKFFDVIAEYGEKPQRVIGYSLLVVIGFATAFGLFWGPSGFETGGTAPYDRPILGYVIVSLASFTAFVMGGSTIIAAPLLRFAALLEAFVGAFLVGLFIFTLTRSVHR